MTFREVRAGIRRNVHQEVVGTKRVLGGEVWAKSEPGNARRFFHAAGNDMKMLDRRF